MREAGSLRGQGDWSQSECESGRTACKSYLTKKGGAAEEEKPPWARWSGKAEVRTQEAESRELEPTRDTTIKHPSTWEPTRNLTLVQRSVQRQNICIEETGRQRQTDRQTHRHAYRQRDR